MHHLAMYFRGEVVPAHFLKHISIVARPRRAMASGSLLKPRARARSLPMRVNCFRHRRVVRIVRRRSTRQSLAVAATQAREPISSRDEDWVEEPDNRGGAVAGSPSPAAARMDVVASSSDLLNGSSLGIATTPPVEVIGDLEKVHVNGPGGTGLNRWDVIGSGALAGSVGCAVAAVLSEQVAFALAPILLPCVAFAAGIKSRAVRRQALISRIERTKEALEAWQVQNERAGYMAVADAIERSGRLTVETLTEEMSSRNREDIMAPLEQRLLQLETGLRVSVRISKQLQQATGGTDTIASRVSEKLGSSLDALKEDLSKYKRAQDLAGSNSKAQSDEAMNSVRTRLLAIESSVRAVRAEQADAMSQLISSQRVNLDDFEKSLLSEVSRSLRPMQQLPQLLSAAAQGGAAAATISSSMLPSAAPSRASGVPVDLTSETVEELQAAFARELAETMRVSELNPEQWSMLGERLRQLEVGMSSIEDSLPKNVEERDNAVLAALKRLEEENARYREELLESVEKIIAKERDSGPLSGPSPSEASLQQVGDLVDIVRDLQESMRTVAPEATDQRDSSAAESRAEVEDVVMSSKATDGGEGVEESGSSPIDEGDELKEAGDDEMSATPPGDAQASEQEQDDEDDERKSSADEAAEVLPIPFQSDVGVPNEGEARGAEGGADPSTSGDAPIGSPASATPATSKLRQQEQQEQQGQRRQKQEQRDARRRNRARRPMPNIDIASMTMRDAVDMNKKARKILATDPRIENLDYVDELSRISALVLKRFRESEGAGGPAEGNLGNALLIRGEAKLRMAQAIVVYGPGEGSGEDAILKECEEILVRAGRSFRSVLRERQDDTRALLAWGKALSIRGEASMSPSGDRAVALRLYEAAEEKFRALMEIEPNRVGSMISAADAALKVYRLSSDLDVRQSALSRARATYIEVLRLSAGNVEASRGLDVCEQLRMTGSG